MRQWARFLRTTPCLLLLIDQLGGVGQVGPAQPFELLDDPQPGEADGPRLGVEDKRCVHRAHTVLLSARRETSRVTTIAM